jgi:hypothetical protein
MWPLISPTAFINSRSIRDRTRQVKPIRSFKPTFARSDYQWNRGRSFGFFALKGLKAEAIQAELEFVYGTDACKLLMVKKWLLRFVQGRTTQFDDPRSARLLTQDLAEAVQSTLAERPLASWRVLCRHFRIAGTAYLRILQDELGLQKFHLRSLPHAASSDPKSERLIYSSLLLEVLEEAQRLGFERVITGDESWFFLSDPHDSVEATSRNELSHFD